MYDIFMTYKQIYIFTYTYIYIYISIIKYIYMPTFTIKLGQVKYSIPWIPKGWDVHPENASEKNVKLQRDGG